MRKQAEKEERAHQLAKRREEKAKKAPRHVQRIEHFSEMQWTLQG